ncbi:MAG: Trp biosynthesis-associated membrane protein [Actinomycetota bacterium]|nr:Trp biosynthesis-associated membrane protein [Actinomycetota bacterium]
MRAAPHRELAIACLVALAGGVCVLVATGQRWRPAHAAAVGAAVTGQQLVPVARALGLVGLAGVVALLAARGWTRPAVGVALVLSGVGIIGAAAAVLGGTGVLWPAVTGLGGVLLLAAGGLATVRGRSWPALGARYDAPSTRSRGTVDAWTALDRGEDPTAHTGRD